MNVEEGNCLSTCAAALPIFSLITSDAYAFASSTLGSIKRIASFFLIDTGDGTMKAIETGKYF